jgi:uncharacterized protein (DUF302 family)
MTAMTWAKGLVLAAGVATLSGCGTIKAIGNLEEGAGETFMAMWDRWVDAEGDIGYATTWEMKVKDGVKLEDVIDAINAVGTNRNIKSVGELPLSKELQARGVTSGVIHVMSFCNPETARKMVDFSPAMGAYLPCRVTIVEKADGLYLYTLNMDMMVKMGKKLPPELKAAAMDVRDTIWEMMEKGAKGEF